MPKTMTFAIGGREYTADPRKFDRKKLSGWREVRAFDDNGNECTLVSTDASGTIIIPKGGVGLGIESGEGKWVERSSLKTVGADGGDLEMVQSSYSGVNMLTAKATEEELLDCSITAFYHLAEAGADLIGAIGDDIYNFDYCYRDSYETSPAFLLASEAEGKKELFMFIGTQNNFDYISLNEIAVADEAGSDDEDEGDGDGEIDFSMM
jgi:hypothetical protein